MFCVRKAVTVLSLGLALTVCRNAHAAPGIDVVFQQGSLGATAFFNTVDESGCISTRVFVIANADSERVLPAPGTRSAQVALVISQVDLCRVAQILTGNGVSDDATIVVSPNLRDATVSAVVPVLNLANGSAVDVFVDLTFVGTSIMVADNGVELNPYIPGYFINTTFNQTFRYATATGSVMTVDGELTPEPSIEAMIQNVRVGTVVIARP
jgi:hypothetical protein